jgi:hypothetical protein
MDRIIVSPAMLRNLIQVDMKIVALAEVRVDEQVDDRVVMVGVIKFKGTRREMFLGDRKGEKVVRAKSIDTLVYSLYSCGINEVRVNPKGIISRNDRYYPAKSRQRALKFEEMEMAG